MMRVIGFAYLLHVCMEETFYAPVDIQVDAFMFYSSCSFMHVHGGNGTDTLTGNGSGIYFMYVHGENKRKLKMSQSILYVHERNSPCFSRYP